MSKVYEQTIDPVTLEVIRNALPAISNEMSADLQRASYNMMVYEVRDYCCALIDKKGRLISQNLGGVSHFVADLGVIIEDAMKKYGEHGFEKGDVLITNHQGVAGQHLNNIVIYTPIFDKDELFCFAMVRAHWMDVGGLSTGFGGGVKITDPWMEGLQLDQLKIIEAGKYNQTLLQIIKDNIRYPESSLGDMRAQIASCALAERRIEELFTKYGSEKVQYYIETIFSKTEEKCRKIISQIPNGEYEAESWIDDDGYTTNDPVRIHARVVVRDDNMTIDFSGCSAQRKGAINSRSLAGAVVAFKAITTPLDPVNEGSFRALEVVIPEGNVMMAKYPAPMAKWSIILPTVIDTVLKALAPALPDKIPAAHMGYLGGTIVCFGQDPRTNKRFVLQSIEGGGWGGRPHEDGESASVSVCQGDVRNAPIESIEIKAPVLIEERVLRTDSGGAGKNRGGLGLDVRVRNLVEVQWNLTQGRRRQCPPWGLWGGKEGANSDYLLKLPNEDTWNSVDVYRYTVPKDTEVIVRTPGGGGWGSPLEREVEKVQLDVKEGYISLEKARTDYGVVLNPTDLSVDEKATENLRQNMKKGME
ncbi:hydantoinase B/oxoprolinase family protein [Bacillus sp. Marseille-P3661]|uniref:hydantoinase B/oxoprolinase family protein n=1 Tax=Bacillus sp. Marseille-P3661 TaxID=1936234 RepID=UPI000C835255|nr:hydantoinase B/oxoprolinase family protein [Bacillus sp. Marseille-P3661]